LIFFDFFAFLKSYGTNWEEKYTTYRVYWLYVRTEKKMRRGPIFVFIEFLKRSRWSEIECHLSLLEQTTIIDRTNKFFSFSSSEEKMLDKKVRTTV
jgi:hypothetical protein